MTAKVKPGVFRELNRQPNPRPKPKFKVGQKVKVKGTSTHDGIGTVHTITDTQGPHKYMYTITFGEKTFKSVTNALKGNMDPVPTTITRTEKKIPNAAMVFEYQLESA